jgi:hypothetical protein
MISIYNVLIQVSLHKEHNIKYECIDMNIFDNTITTERLDSQYFNLSTQPLEVVYVSRMLLTLYVQ